MCIDLVSKYSFWTDDLLKDMFSDVDVDGWQWIIKQIHILILVDGASEAYTLLLSATQINTLMCKNMNKSNNKSVMFK